MFKSNANFFLLSTLTAVLLSTSGCSSGGSDNNDGDEPTYSVDAQSVQLPEQFSIVLDASKVAKQSPSRYMASYARINSPTRAIAFRANYDGAQSDYSKTEANIWDGNFKDSLSFPNYLAKLLAQSNASEFINQGKYIALFDEIEKPFGGEDATGGTTSSSSSTTVKKETAVFEVIQVNSTDPLTIKMWMDIDTGWGGTISLYGETIVTQNQSDSYPLGEFTIYYSTVYKDGSGNEYANGDKNALNVSADANDILISFKNIWSWGDTDKSEFTFQNRVAKDYSNGAFKQLYTSTYSYGGTTNTYSYDFDVAYDESTIVEKYPSWSGYDVNTTYDIRYYNLNDSKSIVYNYALFNEADGSKKEINTGYSVTFVDSDGISHYGYASPWGTWIDGNISNGDTVTSNFDNQEYTATVYRGNLQKEQVTLQTLSDLNGTSCDAWECDTNGCKEYNIAWNSATQSMEYDSYRDENYEVVDLNQTEVLAFDGGYLWCGNKSYEVDYTSDANNSTPVKSYEYITITPDNAIDLTGLSGYVYDTGTDNNFSFDATRFMLVNDTTGVDADALNADEYIWQSVEDENGSRYTWSISSYDWAKSVLLKDSNSDAMVFDEPLEFRYTHTLANDRNDDNSSVGEVLDLTYEGYGLYIPWTSTANSYAPQVSLKDSVLLTDKYNDKYVVKATDIGIEYTELSSAPSVVPEFISVDLDSISIDTSDFSYETLGDTTALEVKVINKVTQ